jgi:hypothetical protein
LLISYKKYQHLYDVLLSEFSKQGEGDPTGNLKNAYRHGAVSNQTAVISVLEMFLFGIVSKFGISKCLNTDSKWHVSVGMDIQIYRNYALPMSVQTLSSISLHSYTPWSCTLYTTMKQLALQWQFMIFQLAIEIKVSESELVQLVQIQTLLSFWIRKHFQIKTFPPLHGQSSIKWIRISYRIWNDLLPRIIKSYKPLPFKNILVTKLLGLCGNLNCYIHVTTTNWIKRHHVTCR